MEKRTNYPQLTEKQNHFFKLIVDTYIKTGASVASKELVKRCNLKCSSATIRNVMASLEQIGFLEKYHISSGRVPSTLGLEYYAKFLVYNPKKYFDQKLEDLLAKRRIKIDATLEEAAAIVSEVAGVTVVATSNNAAETMKSIQLTTLSELSAIVVIVTSSGRVESKIFNFENSDISLEDLRVAIRLFKERLVDTPLIHLANKARALTPIFGQQLKNYELILQKFIKNIFVFEEETTNKTFNKGAIVLSRNISREEIANVLDLIEKHSVWESIDNDLDEDNNIKLDVSRPNLSIISKKIDFSNEKNIKEITVIGPNNLDYGESFEALEMLEKIIKEKK
ncbi:heat inducible transcription repressor HrcA [Metamycoplasma arthritidis]|uniref:Heat-inducible transcription repressor HrcA n=1 Tax=Metamycoplasma arthritidis (strain 158L3-1) TaxID=243272 RepID=HRCA_META1|nr:heat-inducible transcriptional repressor HrcA [Metamycoplasma arthritidis]B3PN01.1 RecName: Full=Heat-inducible transcription repressor HrcA [Metamycoplasma arthritidis 158L3-1]ACF07403.1 heat-inducible transcription repressor [Metamycoplasma arthritidis 158L3-1]VEU78925.1 heat inducible transcription repressor HrcA [Metamycoplasma arthritidis]